MNILQNLKENRKAFYCECSHPFHQLVLDKDSDGSLVISYQLNHYLPWYKRLINAIYYVLGWDRDKLDYNEIWLNTDEQKELVKFIDAR